jgi:Host cell surface-exposed lipoprotein/Protein of unknown function (DUF732)
VSETPTSPTDPTRHWDGQQWLKWDGAAWLPEDVHAPRPLPLPKEPKTGNWFGRHKVLTALGAVVLLIVVASAAAAAGGGGKATPVAGGIASPTAVASTSPTASVSAEDQFYVDLTRQDGSFYPIDKVTLVRAGQAACTSLAASAPQSMLDAGASSGLSTVQSLELIQYAATDLCPAQLGAVTAFLATSPSAAATATPAPTGPAGTVSELSALQSAQSYLDMGSGFSRLGLIDQLDSAAGEGFSKADATWAVSHLKVDWNAQAVLSAKGYMAIGGFSRNSLINQLDSAAGEKFTRAQAIYAAKAVGLG